jgi:uncharacterized lipoprotein NlpE involved in copper resistance
MKKIIFSALTLITLSLVGCNGGGDPKSVLSSFFEALGKKDFTAAKKYATKDSESMLGMIESMSKGSDKSETKYDKNNMEFGDTKIEGDKATVPVKDKKSGETTNYILKKENGKWKVAFDKATMMQMSTDKMKDAPNPSGTMTDTTKTNMGPDSVK